MNKAYQVSSDSIRNIRDRLYNVFRIYADDEEQAKSIAYNEGYFEGCGIKVLYEDLVAERLEEFDKILIDDQWLTPEDAWVYTRNKFVKYSDPTKIYMIKESNMYWRYGSRGYTYKYLEAGLYSYEEASHIVLKSEYKRQRTIEEFSQEKAEEEYNTELSIIDKEILELKRKKDEITEIYLRQLL